MLFLVADPTQYRGFHLYRSDHDGRAPCVHHVLQLRDRIAERLEYTLGEGDVEVLREIPRDPESVLAFTLGQRRELYSGEGENRERFSAPKYLEVGWYRPDGQPQSVVYKDAVVPAEKAESWLEKTWCEDGGFVEEALAAKGAFVVSGMTGCACRSALAPREKGLWASDSTGEFESRRRSREKTVPRPQWLPWFWRSCILGGH